jgi:hypothetical protein
VLEQMMRRVELYVPAQLAHLVSNTISMVFKVQLSDNQSHSHRTGGEENQHRLESEAKPDAR